MFAQEFFRNALLAGSFIALACGLVGYFVVLRAQVFAGDALSHVAFTGAVAAAAAGLDTRIGLFAATIAVALLLGAIGPRAGADDVAIGILFVWVLGLGVLFLAIFTSGSSGGNGVLGARALFGSIFGLSGADARLAAVVGAVIAVAVLAIARPLLFASVDPVVAAGRGVRVTALGVVFLALVGATAAEATQAVGALLLLGLLAAPAGAAQRLTANPYLGLGISALLALAAMWLGLALSYWIPSLPEQRDHRGGGGELPARAARDRDRPRDHAGAGPEDRAAGAFRPAGHGARIRLKLEMARKQQTGWAAAAQDVLVQNGHHSGQARRSLLELLDSQPCALSAIEIEQRLRASRRPVARASIYRILDELERLHLVQRVEVGQDMARYEPIRTGEGHHHHLVCDSCGTVTPFTDEGLEDAIRKLSRRLPMQVDEHEIVLRGACETCNPA